LKEIISNKKIIFTKLPYFTKNENYLLFCVFLLLFGFSQEKKQSIKRNELKGNVY
jgi:hypothetical protein